MLRPVETETRTARLLDGVWQFRPDPQQEGERCGWHKGLPGATRPIAVPGSWNEQGVDPDERDHIGVAWYQTDFQAPQPATGRRLWLRFDAVFRRARSWVNGHAVGDLEVPFLPWEVDVTKWLARDGVNRLVVLVSNATSPGDLLSGHTEPWQLPPIGVGQVPWVNFDWYPYGGIHGSVWLLTLPQYHFESVRVETLSLSRQSARVQVSVRVTGKRRNGQIRLRLRAGKQVVASTSLSPSSLSGLLTVARPQPWSPATPFLYHAEIEWYDEGGRLRDAYQLRVGLRTVVVRRQRLLLNGRPIFLRGFGRHEDFPVAGKAALPALAVRDNRLFHWIGANSFRTAHYPGHETTLDLADETGILVIDEAPANGLCFDGTRGTPKSLWPSHRAMIEALVERDANHPSVIMWSVANEPQTHHPAAATHFRRALKYTRSLDRLRPVTVVTFRGDWVSPAGREIEHVNRLADVVCVNRYFGWYTHYGQIKEAMAALERDLEALRSLGKPVVLTEFGAESLPGLHDTVDRQFTEEYQADLLAATLRVAAAKSFVVGTHVWCFADFMTPQSVSRVMGNHKGVFSRIREPKRAAWMLREIWRSA